MSKKKKGKVISSRPVQLSPEKYIKTYARTLPIVECLISDDWKNSGICHIVVARGHTNGNITAGFYLADLYCLGVKTVHYKFNIPRYEFDKWTYPIKAKRCDYVLAHNIIYGAIAYAEDYGFKPHKNFALAQFILKEDDELIDLVEIEFGLNGQPCYFQGPYDDPVKIKNIISTLTRTAGEGNFSIVEKDGDEDDWDGEHDDDEMFDEQKEQLREFYETIDIIDKAYDATIRAPEEKKILEQPAIGAGYEISADGVESDYNTFDNDQQEEAYDSFRELVLHDGAIEKAIKGLEKAITRYPQKPLFYNLLQSAYVFAKRIDESNKLIHQMYGLFPNYLFAMVQYANFLIDSGKHEQALAVFKGARDLNELYPQRKVFGIAEATAYFGTMCRYFTAVDDIDTSDLYKDALFKYCTKDTSGQTVAVKAIKELYKAKVKKVEKYK